MKLSHLPLLQVQRDLYAVPRGMERFREYIKSMTDAETGDLAYTREVIAPHLQATDRATVIAGLFGDAAATALGYPPLGLSDRAGLALALQDAPKNE